MSENKSSSQKSWLSVGLILVLCVVNLLLIKQNLDLRKQLAAGGRTIDVTTNFLQPGDVVAPVTATDLEGRPYQLDYKKDGRQRLLLYFSPHCPYCQQQSPLWRDLLDKVDKLSATPTTLLINEDGKVEHAWIGKWDETSASEVAATLK